MILVLGVWTFLRALLGHSPAVALENIAFAINSWSCSGPLAAHASRGGTGVHWIGLSGVWTGCHREGFKLYWRLGREPPASVARRSTPSCAT